MSKGIKTFFKVLYICAGLIVLVFIYLLSYNNYTLTRIQTLTNDAIAEKNYSELEKIFGSFFSTNSIANVERDDYSLVVYPSSVFSSYKYKVDGNEKTYEHSDRGYYIYLIKPKADLVNDATIGTTTNNKSGVKYTFTDGKEYTYYFQLSDKYNFDYYIAEPTTAEQAILHGERNLISIYSYLNYFDISLSESIVNFMKKEISSEGTIEKLTFVDSTGKEVDGGYNVNLDFSQAWYSNIEEYVAKYNKYIEEYTATTDNEVKSNLTKEFEKYFYGENNDGFYYQFQKIEGNGVARGRDYVYPASLIWQSIGMCALVLVVIFLLYMLIFHFNLLKTLVHRIGRREENLGRAGLSAREKRNLVKADYTELQKRNQKASEAASSKINNTETETENKEDKKDE